MILPGEWLGVLGGGQLGRLFALAARQMGYRVLVLDPAHDCPASAVADRHLCADYLDQAALAEIARTCRAVTTEFENVPAAALDLLARDLIVRPRGAHVAIAQDRIREKQFLEQNGVAIAPWRAIYGNDDLAPALTDGLLPGILKCSRSGYDGKGQRRVRDANEARATFAEFGGVPCVLEKQIDLATEISVVVARDAVGATLTYPVTENMHADGILDVSVVPARIPAALGDTARATALSIAQALDYTGVMCVEYFVLKDGRLLVNEIAPRPHNSGHYSIDACLTSQFAQQVRVLAGLPLGETSLLRPAVMVNLLGDLWRHGEPRWERLLTERNLRLHLYGKQSARPGRKMGHYTVLGEDAAPCHALALRMRESLVNA
jgi:5-(carboxyamino)imidazole ribonucleotide synthase